MSTRDQEEVRDLLQSASEQPTEVRTGFVRSRLADRTTLRNEALALLPYFQRSQEYEPPRPAGGVLRFPSTAAVAQVHRHLQRGLPLDFFPAPPFFIDQYRVDEFLSAGGMGMVYRASHPSLKVDVAIKLIRLGRMSRDLQRRFALEVEILRQLRHPGICTLIHTGFAPIRVKFGSRLERFDTPYFVMELVQGSPLTDFAEAAACGARERLELLMRICEAVDFAHHRGVVHRDLKPANILVTSVGYPKILDFGIARLEDDVANACGDERGRFIGTPTYASPEQLAGVTDRITARSDVFSLGVIAHELLTGALPERRGNKRIVNVLALRWDSGREPLAVEPRELQFHVRAVLESALQVDEGARCPSARALAERIEAVVQTCFPRPIDTFWSNLGKWWRQWVGGQTSEQKEPPLSARALRAVLQTRIRMGVEATDFGRPPLNADAPTVRPDATTKPCDPPGR